MSKTIGERLRELRTKRNLKQRDVAKILGISPIGYAYYEQGRRRPSYETLYKLAELFGVSTDYLLGLSDDSNPQQSTIRVDSPSSVSSPDANHADKTFTALYRPKDTYQQMIDEAIEQLDPEERRIIEKIRSMPDLDLQFKDFESDPVQNLRDLVKVWREIHPEDFEEEQKETTSSTASSANELQIVLNRIEELKQLLGEIKDRLSGISRLERYLALIAGVGLDELLLLRRLREHPELIERFMEQLKKLESRNEKN